LGVRNTPRELAAMMELATDDPGALARLYDIGRAAGQAYFSREPGQPDWRQLIFPARFDPPWFQGPPQTPPRSRLEAMARFRRS
jgi:hypothetical protein